MKTKPLTARDLERIPRANLVDFLLLGVYQLEIDIKLNELDEKPDLIFASTERKIKIKNLIKL